ncbi:transcriptional regulator, TetR family [Polaromonas sp. OV174]|uniref:TetR family transcriptional regulator n=1 Tax=Polaromonas sp. OV174 TaxID=1855300 RepID=UPI0008E4D1F1|nr:TetR family transcriptional regulator [Polaromonas sp. OV174]SFC42944.1 transcriptional regulator, TetR family [Polaromonas sp. OV174]
MARRTKEEALATRNRLLDAAECLFQEQGVSRTSLQDIAKRAGATRGAVYWHFKDKAALFNAMMERVTLPMEEALDHKDDDSTDDINPLHRIRLTTIDALRQIVTDAQTRRVFEVATHKVEYVEELQAVRLRHLAVCNGFVNRIEQRMHAGARQMHVSLPVTAAVAARGLHALIVGLIQSWLLDPGVFDLLAVGQCAMNVYLRGLGFTDEQDISASPKSQPKAH